MLKLISLNRKKITSNVTVRFLTISNQSAQQKMTNVMLELILRVVQPVEPCYSCDQWWLVDSIPHRGREFLTISVLRDVLTINVNKNDTSHSTALLLSLKFVFAPLPTAKKSTRSRPDLILRQGMDSPVYDTSMRTCQPRSSAIFILFVIDI